MSNADYEVPNQTESIIDGIAINPQGALSGQALIYDSINNEFIPGSSSGNVTGFFTTGQIAYAVGTSSLSSNSNFVWDNTDGYLGIGTSSPSYQLHTIGDGYFTKRVILNGDTASISPSGAGALRFNSSTNHLEFSENGGAWAQFGSIGTSIGSSTAKSVLYIDGSNRLAQDNSNFAWDYTNHRLGIGNNSPSYPLDVTGIGRFTGHILADGYTIDMSAGATSGQALIFNGTSFVPTNQTGGVQGTLTSTKVPYATGSATIANSGMTWDNTNKVLSVTTITGNNGVQVTDATRTIAMGVSSGNGGLIGTTSNHNLTFFTNNSAAQMILSTSGQFGIGTTPSFALHVVGDGYFTSRAVIGASSAAVSSSGTGALRFNTSTSHLEFSENGGAWNQIASGSSSGMVIGNTVTSGTSGSILYVDNSSNLAQDNSKFYWDDTNIRFGAGTGSPVATIDGYQKSVTSGAPVVARFFGAAHTTLPASTEVLDVYFNLARTIQLNTGALSTQRAVLVTAPTYSFVGASTITTAASFTVSDAPQSGTNATITNRYSIWAQNGVAAFDGHIKVDGYTIDLSAGATTNQVLTYNGTKFLAQSNSATQGGTTTASHIPYASSSNTLSDTTAAWDNANKVLTVTTNSGNNGVTVTDGTRTIGVGVTSTTGQVGTTSNHNLSFLANNSAQMTLNTSGQLGIGAAPSFALHVVGDGYATSRMILAASSAAVSPSATGAFRFNTSTSHLEFSENGGAWNQVASSSSANMAIGNSITSATPGSVLFADASSNLGQDNANFFWDTTNHALGIGTTSPRSALPVNLAVVNANANAVGGQIALKNTNTVGQTEVDWLDKNNAFRMSVGFDNNSLSTTPDCYIYTASGTDFRLEVNNAAHTTYFKSGGTVGIDQSNPLSKLDVNGSVTIGSFSGTAAPTNGLIVSGSAEFGTTNSTAASEHQVAIAKDVTYPNDVTNSQLSICGATTPGKEIAIGYDTSTTNGFGFLAAGNRAVTWTWLALQPTGGFVGIGTGSTQPAATFEVKPPISTTGSPIGMQYTGAAHTTLTASTEANDINLNMSRTVQFSSGSFSTQRALLIQAPTYAFTGVSTITNAATVAITNAPQPGANATITNPYSLWCQAGLAAFDAHVKVDGYKIDLSGGATSTQVLAYNGTAFVPTNAAAGSITGSIATNQVAYGSGANAIQGSANLTYNGTTLTVAQHISVDGYTIDISAGATNGQALVYSSGSGKFIAQTVSGGGGGSSIGATGQKFITHISAGFASNNSTTTQQTVGACSFTPTNYVITGTTQSAEFRVVAACGNATVTGHAKLRDITNSVDITTFNITGTSDTTYTQVLTISSAGANSITSGTAIYEIRIYVDNPLQTTDFIQLYMAEIRNINTIN